MFLKIINPTFTERLIKKKNLKKVFQIPHTVSFKIL